MPGNDRHARALAGGDAVRRSLLRRPSRLLRQGRSHDGAAYTPDDTYTSVRGPDWRSPSGRGSPVRGPGAQHPDTGARLGGAPGDAGSAARPPYGPSSDPAAGSSFAQGSEDDRLRDILRPREEEVRRARPDPPGDCRCRGTSSRARRSGSRSSPGPASMTWSITVHCMIYARRPSMSRSRRLLIYRRSDVLGPDLLLVYCIQGNEEEICWPADTRTPVSISILSGDALRHGTPPTLFAMVNAGAPMSFLARHRGGERQTPDMFTAMRASRWASNGRRAPETARSTCQRQVQPRHATSEGAAILGRPTTGQLREGWRADGPCCAPTTQHGADQRWMDRPCSPHKPNVDTVPIEVLRKTTAS